jgi:hypothetical protein
MNSEAGARVMPMPAATEEKKRPGRKPAESREKGGTRVLFYLGDGGTAEHQLVVLKEECAGEGEAMIESLKRGAPYYRVEIWQARAVVKDGSVEVKKDQLSVRT